MTAQRNPPVDTRSSPSDDSDNGPVEVRNESARKSGSLHYHQPLLHDDEINTPAKLSASKKKKKQINVEQLQKPRENAPTSESASMVSLERRNRSFIRKEVADEFGIFRLTEHVIVATFGNMRQHKKLQRVQLSRKKHSDDRSYCCHINLLRSGSIEECTHFHKLELSEKIPRTSAEIGIFIGINYSYGFVLAGVIKKEESTVASEFHSRLDHVRKQIPDPKSAKMKKFWELESVDILDSVEDNATSSKLKQTFKEAVQFYGKRYTVDPL
ncbi:hypothetical protein T07_302 [Trichinella nelsoni]|nr:hypothetical protein T07_302 [Trichinella nelsoni]